MNWRAEINARRFSNEIFQAEFAGRPVPFSGNYRRHKNGEKKGYSYRKKVNQEAVRNE